MTHRNLILILAVLVAISLQSISAETVDPGADFGGYVEELKRMEEEEARYEAKLNAHEEWRQTTWSGTAVRKIQGLALHFKPFLLAVQDAMSAHDHGDRNLTQVVAYIGIRMMFVLLMLLILFTGSKLFQTLIGGDFEIVQEVVIVHEHETEAEAAKARQGTTRSKRKKQKQKNA